MDNKKRVYNGLNATLIQTLKKKIEELKNSEEKWHSLVENAPNIIIIADRDGTIQFINHTVSSLTVEGTIGTKLYDYVPKEYHNLMRKTTDQVFRTGKPGSYETKGEGPDGSISWYFTQVGPILREGKVVAATLIITDLTERKKAEETLRESEEKYGAIVENATDWIFMIDRNNRFLSVNRAITALFRKPLAEIIGKFLVDIFPKEIAAQFLKNLKSVFQTGKSRLVEEKMIIAGHEFWITTNLNPVRDSQGRVTAVMGITRDITERKKVEEKIKLFSSAVESAYDGFALADITGKVTYANQATLKLFGYTLKEIMKLKVTDFSPNLKVAKKILAGLMEKGKWSGEIISLKKNKKRFSIALSASLVKDEKGKPIAITGVFRDITKQKKADEELHELKKEARGKQ